MSARRKVLEQMLVEAAGDSPRSVVEGSVRLTENGVLDWTEKGRRGQQARTTLVHWPTFWDLVDDALDSSTPPASDGGVA